MKQQVVGQRLQEVLKHGDMSSIPKWVAKNLGQIHLVHSILHVPARILVLP